MPQTIELSLVSHTNVGKTTLARTLLGRDIGDVRDEPHVTQSAEVHEMEATPDGDRLVLWDTPGFGDSGRLAKRLEQSDNPLGWFLSEVWDRYRDRAFWSSQQAVRNVRDHADVVMYLVNAAEDPQDAGYVGPEMRVLEWCGKPVVVMLNQLGPPRPAAEEQADVARWSSHLARFRCVHAVLPVDAFARCWVQEAVLIGELKTAVPAAKRDVFSYLSAQWLRRRREIFDASLQLLAVRLARAALDHESLAAGSWTDSVREIGTALGFRREPGGSRKQMAMRALAERLDQDIRTSSDRLIALHGLGGFATAEILIRVADQYAIRERLNEGKAAAVGGVITGALAGLKADLATGGMTFGAGLLVGGVLGALGTAGLARGYNLVSGADVTTLAWTEDVLDELAVSALLGYLAVAHYGRGRGAWAESESPPHWLNIVTEVFAQQRQAFHDAWVLRKDAATAKTIGPALQHVLACTASAVLQRLYPGVVIDFGSSHDELPHTAP